TVNASQRWPDLLARRLVRHRGDARIGRLAGDRHGACCRYHEPTQRYKPDVDLTLEDLMRKLMLKMSISMDGFCADSDPGGPQQWLFDTADDESNAWEVSFLKEAGYHAMGSKTYRVMASYWPVSTDRFADLMNTIPKVIFTRKGLGADDETITPRAVAEARNNPKGKAIPNDDIIRSWTHPRVAKGDLGEEIAKLKREDGKFIVAYGGASFAQSLIELDVVDEYRFLIHPMVLGAGLPIFTKAQKLMELELVEERRFPKGAVAHVYRRKRD
ncbi:MAG: dihydrofolate reductase family protein, partial [Kofleriaceae bacterium]